MNFKRRKPRRDIKCPLCTQHRKGNSRKDSSRKMKVSQLRKKENLDEIGA